MVSPLDRKLLRDLWRIKGQAAAIALVIALGVLLLVMMDGLVNTLDETRKAYYQRYRLADVFVPVKRAPDNVLRQLRGLEGVTFVEGRVTGDALITLPNIAIPLRAQAVSLPDNREPTLNNIVLTRGRMLNARHADEILLLDSFAAARNLVPGDTLVATMNGTRRQFDIVGLAQSPEFLYTTAPGELVPDDGRFAVIWMSQTALAAVYDMQGAFNEALLATSRTARLPAILAQTDNIVQRYGGLGAYGLEDQASNRLVTEEISGLRASAVGVPPVFLAVAAFLLYIVISRMVQSEREQIGLLKAFGYSSQEVSGHYLKLVIVIATAGAIAGSLLGIASGRMIAAVTGIATGMALSVGMISVLSGFDTTIDVTFSVVDRSDATVTFSHAVADKARFELQALDGVIDVEPFRNVAVVFRHGRYSYRGAINGLTAAPKLYRALDSNFQPMLLEQNGIVIARPLADILHISAGERLTVEVREGQP